MPERYAKPLQERAIWNNGVRSSLGRGRGHTTCALRLPFGDDRVSPSDAFRDALALAPMATAARCPSRFALREGNRSEMLERSRGCLALDCQLRPRRDRDGRWLTARLPRELPPGRARPAIPGKPVLSTTFPLGDGESGSPRGEPLAISVQVGIAAIVVRESLRRALPPRS